MIVVVIAGAHHSARLLAVCYDTMASYGSVSYTVIEIMSIRH